MLFSSLSSEKKTHLVFFGAYLLIFCFNDISSLLFYVITTRDWTFVSLEMKIIEVPLLFFFGLLVVVCFRFLKLSGKFFEGFKFFSNLTLFLMYCELRILDNSWFKQEEFDFGLVVGVFILHSFIHFKNFNLAFVLFLVEMIYLALRIDFFSGIHIQKIGTLLIFVPFVLKNTEFKERIYKIPNVKTPKLCVTKHSKFALKILTYFNSEGFLFFDDHKTVIHSNQKLSELLGRAEEDILGRVLDLELKNQPNMYVFEEDKEHILIKKTPKHFFEELIQQRSLSSLRQIIEEISKNAQDCEQETLELSFEISSREKMCLMDEFLTPKLVLTVFFKSNKIKGYLVQIQLICNHTILLNNEKLNQNKKVFFVSHEMRTPLNCIVSMLQILKPLIPEELRHEYVQPAIISCNFLLYLVQDLLDMAQMESDKFSMNFEEFDIRLLISDIIELFKIQASSKNTQISENILPMVPETIVSDHRRIRQILINLIGNALKFMKKVNGKIVIEVSISEENFSHILIAVHDNGIGIKEEDRTKLFQAFGKINNEENKKRNACGVGLGLMISNNLAINLHPSKSQGLKVESTYGSGTTFSFLVEDKTEMSNLKESYREKNKNLGENYQELLTKMEDSKFLHRKSLNGGERLFEKSNNSKNKSYSSLKITFHKRVSSNVYYQLTPLLKERETFNIKEHNEQVKQLRKSLKNKKNETGPKLNTLQPSFHSFCDIFIAKNAIDDYQSAEDKMNLIRELNAMKQCNCPDILIVDDNAFNIYSLRKQLESFNFKIESANDGEEAVQMVQEFKQKYICCKNYRSIFMDIEMPGKNGYQASQDIRSFLKESGDLKIIACSAHLKEEIPEFYKKSGMDEFVTKPIIKGKLVVLLAKFLDIMYNFNGIEPIK